MTGSQPTLRLGSMEAVFVVLVVIIGLIGFFMLLPLMFTLIWVVIPALLTIAVVVGAMVMLWRLVRA